ncbi:MAG: hypothetical protein KBB71_04835 [Lentimicrobiaceae bacterium]|nr:hypothetical protein [Lentimicrobiaceae bacterium]
MLKTKTYPYTLNQLKYFQKEIKKAGGFDELMIQKEALKRDNHLTFIAIYPDKEKYRQKFLIGIYQPLQVYYQTEVPYVFWSRLNEMLQRI